MNCVHGVRMDRDCWWCATGEEPAPRVDGEVGRLRSALQAAEDRVLAKDLEALTERGRYMDQLEKGAQLLLENGDLREKLAAAERERDEARKLLENVVALDDLGKTVPRGAAGAGFQIHERWETTIRRAREVLSRG